MSRPVTQPWGRPPASRPIASQPPAHLSASSRRGRRNIRPSATDCGPAGIPDSPGSPSGTARPQNPAPCRWVRPVPGALRPPSSSTPSAAPFHPLPAIARHLWESLPSSVLPIITPNGNTDTRDEVSPPLSSQTHRRRWPDERPTKPLNCPPRETPVSRPSRHFGCALAHRKLGTPRTPIAQTSKIFAPYSSAIYRYSTPNPQIRCSIFKVGRASGLSKARTDPRSHHVHTSSN